EDSCTPRHYRAPRVRVESYQAADTPRAGVLPLASVEETPMRRHFTWAFCLLVLGAGLSRADDEKKPATKSNEVEVRFGDGSKVRMLLLQETIEIETRYGKLHVPAADIRGIEMGVHLPEGMEEKILKALRRLNSPSFKERDVAVNELVEIGVHAYPALVTA